MEVQINNKRKIDYCPNCNSEIFFCLDEWGYTPLHLHCDKCNIDIGCTSFEKAIELLQDNHDKNTYIEYYNDEIKFKTINDKIIIDKLKNS